MKLSWFSVPTDLFKPVSDGIPHAQAALHETSISQYDWCLIWSKHQGWPVHFTVWLVHLTVWPVLNFTIWLVLNFHVGWSHGFPKMKHRFPKITRRPWNCPSVYNPTRWCPPRVQTRTMTFAEKIPTMRLSIFLYFPPVWNLIQYLVSQFSWLFSGWPCLTMKDQLCREAGLSDGLCPG